MHLQKGGGLYKFWMVGRGICPARPNKHKIRNLRVDILCSSKTFYAPPPSQSSEIITGNITERAQWVTPENFRQLRVQILPLDTV